MQDVPEVQADRSAAETLNRLPACVARFNREGRIVYANRKLCEILDRDLGQILGYQCHELGMDQEAWGNWLPKLEQVFQTGTPERFEYLTKVDSQERFVQMWMVPECDEQGQVLTVLAFAVTNNKVQDLRLALQTQMDLFTAFMDHGPMVAWMRNADGQYVYANEHYFRRYKLAPETLYGKTVFERWPAEIAQQRYANDQLVLQTGKSSQFLESAPEPDGSVKKWLNVKFPFRTPHQETFLGGIGIEVTERLRLDEERLALEQHLQNAQRMESLPLIVASITNHFKNQLTIILNQADLISRRLPPADDLTKKIATAVDRCTDYCTELLRYCGIEVDQRDVVDLNEICQEAQTLLGAIVSRKAIYDFQPSVEPARLIGNRNQLRQMILNLVSFMADSSSDTKSPIRLKLETLDSPTPSQFKALGFPSPQHPLPRYILLELRAESGTLDEETQTLLYDAAAMFLDRSHALSLAAIRHVVHAHSGELVVLPGAGPGSTIRILLPGQQVEELAPIVALDQRYTILVVDDEKEILAIARETLERSKFHVLVAENGDQAVQQMQNAGKGIDLVLLDVMMPGRGGFATYHELKRLNPEVKVILTSGYTSDAATARFDPRELAGFLAKPYHPETLVAQVRKVLSA